MRKFEIKKSEGFPTMVRVQALGNEYTIFACHFSPSRAEVAYEVLRKNSRKK